jgi:MFS family permease
MAGLKLESAVSNRIPTAAAEPRHAWRVKSFRYFLMGSLVSRVGDWMDMTVLNWAVLQMTGSSVYLGLINACRLLPTFAVSVPAGILADRYDRRKLLIGIQFGNMGFTFLLGWVLMMHTSFWLFALIVTLRSVLQAMDPIIRGTLVPSLVPESCMSSAISMNVAVLNLSRIIGPATAGMLLSVLQADWIFILTGFSTIGVLLSLWYMAPLPSLDLSGKKEGRSFAEVMKFIKEKPLVQALLTLAVVPMLFGFPYTSLMPYFSKELLQLGPTGFGMLLSVSAIGALLGSMGLSVKTPETHVGKWLLLSIVGFGLSLIFFITSTSLTFAMAAMMLVGLTSQTYRTMSRITLQKQVPNEMRGRILSIALMDRGFIPLGAMLIGVAADLLGAKAAGFIMGGSCIAITLAMLLYKKELWRM